MARANRLDQSGVHRKQFDMNKKKLRATSTVCAICGKPLYPEYKWPHPLSTVIDHIIPVTKGGHPSDLSNLQATHNCCNRAKSDKLLRENELVESAPVKSNRLLPHTFDWKTFRGYDSKGKGTTGATGDSNEKKGNEKAKKGSTVRA